ncbi:MAG TPA: hypothetical protein VJJ83_03440, partial [Candidatus Babeliales bacterium]|nr:hypothetical protein [Candidatus Babeliales bacterium]
YSKGLKEFTQAVEQDFQILQLQRNRCTAVRATLAPKTGRVATTGRPAASAAPSWCEDPVKVGAVTVVTAAAFIAYKQDKCTIS